jgi:hypothetical protein
VSSDLLCIENILLLHYRSSLYGLDKVPFPYTCAGTHAFVDGFSIFLMVLFLKRFKIFISDLLSFSMLNAFCLLFKKFAHLKPRKEKK